MAKGRVRVLLGTPGFAVSDADVLKISMEKPCAPEVHPLVRSGALLAKEAPCSASFPADQRHSNMVLLCGVQLNLRSI